jgi:quinol monooxygenase YgiN
MFARNVSIRLKPNTLHDFKQTFEKEVIPMLRKQAGFRDEIAFADDNDTDVTAISLWESREQAETYNSSTYPTVLKTLGKFLDGPPKVRLSNVISSTSHKVTAAAVVAA